MNPALLTIAEAAAYLKLSRADLMARVARGEIGCVRGDTQTVICIRQRQGRTEHLTYTRAHWRFRREDLDAWIVARYRPSKRAPAAPPVVRARGGPKPWEVIARKHRRFA